jgi:2-keto-4-pentenoate hydratase/2-oxohepta-3-ene-1,7-dioic acid hydratase in catechol pathway
MKLMRVGESGREVPAVMTSDGRVLDCSTLCHDFDRAFFGAGGIADLKGRIEATELPELDMARRRIGAPLREPQKIVCVGLNYVTHAQESGQAIPDEPVLFMKSPGTLVGPNDTVLIPKSSTKTDWEVELAVVIGKRASYLSSPSEALSYVAGYAISNDVSEREFQLERGGQWDKGKSCDTFNPLGPWLVSADEVPDPQELEMSLSVNGVQRQHDSTKSMIFSVDYVLWYISQFMVLEAGDVVNTGTPAGVSLGHDDVAYLKSGDVMELEVSGLGRQRQVVAQG